MSVTSRRPGPSLPPRWVMRRFWFAHRRLYRLTGGHLGLWRPKAGRWGAMHLATVGRRTGRRHDVIVGYFEDGPDLVTMAMNGWNKGEPAWFLNLKAHPDAEVHLYGEARLVSAHVATGDERARLWARWRDIDRDLEAYAARRGTETAVVVLTPRSIPSTPGDRQLA